MITSESKDLVQRGMERGLIRLRGIQVDREHGTVSMATIAKIAGVSTMTVSRALRDDPKVAPDTKAKIEAIAVERGYKNECEKCGKKECYISVRVAGEPRKLFCGKQCLVQFYAE